MPHILEKEWLTTSDVSLLPGLGKLKSRSEAVLEPWIISSPMETVTGIELAKQMINQKQLSCISRFLPEDERLRAIREVDDLYGFVAIGLDEIPKILANEWIYTGQLNFCIDVAHGDTTYVHDLVHKLSKSNKANSIMSGSICTPVAAVRAWQAGCDYLRVGVGPGSMCTTRIQTGVGAPNLSAVYQIYRELDKAYYSNFDNAYHRKPVIIADGGIKSPGEAVKYLAAGAKMVMLGSELAKTKEAPGWIGGSFEHGLGPWAKLYYGPPKKLYRGQASKSFQESMFGKSSHVEGVSKSIYWQGDTVESVIATYNNGLASAISYLGLTSTAEINPDSVEMIKITNSGYIEGTPHGTRN